MYRHLGILTTIIALGPMSLSAQARIGTVGAMAVPARGSRVSIEAVPATGMHRASVLITVFNPMQPTMARLSIAQIADLVKLSDSILALPVLPDSGEPIRIPIYGSPLDTGATLSTTRIVTAQRDVMQVQVNTIGTSAIVVLSRSAAEEFIAVLRQVVATSRSLAVPNTVARPKRAGAYPFGHAGTR